MPTPITTSYGSTTGTALLEIEDLVTEFGGGKAFLGKPQRSRPAYAFTATSYDCDFAFEPEVHVDLLVRFLGSSV